VVEQIILGITHGIAEWLPVSSQGLIVLMQKKIFQSSYSVGSLIEVALFLHLGTFFAALVYFRKDITVLFKAIGHFSKSEEETQKTLRFLTVATLLSGLIGVILLTTLINFEKHLEFSGKVITLLIGTFLIITGFIQIKIKERAFRSAESLTLKDGIILGVAQGLAALPGFSRSGLTVASLLFLKFEKSCALRLSFLMSLPIVLFGNIILNFDKLTNFSDFFYGLIFSFVFGLATIHILLKIAKKVNFGSFVIVFGIITVIFGII